MKRITIGKKFTFSTIIVTVIMLLVGFFTLNYNKNLLTQEVYNGVKSELIEASKFKIQSKLDVGVSNAISIANDDMVKSALTQNSRDLAIKALGNLSVKMKEFTPFKNIKVHIHTKDSKSFLRSWKYEKYGDDLSSFRHSVVEVNKTNKAVNTFEVGKAGLSIRSVVPIFDNDNNHLGSLEFMQGINSVAKSFDEVGDAFILLMDDKATVAQFDKKSKLKNFIISQNFLNQNFLTDSNLINFNDLFKNGYLISEKYFYTYIDIKDFQGNKIGIALNGRPIGKVENTLNHTTEIISIALFILALALIVSMVTTLYGVRTTILAPVEDLNKSIIDLTTNSISDSNTKRIQTKSNDEIGDLVKSFNAYLDNIDEGIKKDKAVIDETRNVILKVKKGLLNDRIKGHSSSPEVEALITEINSMMDSLQFILNKLSDTLVSMSNAKYDVAAPKIDGLTGTVASLFSGVDVTRSSINEIICLIDKSNTALTTSAKELSNASIKLSNSSNIQASSLEETAAAIEEISATIRQSSENASQMALYAQNVTKSNNLGKELAFKTSTSMEELNTEVNAIFEAITIIDQIAFQTNILSLNAAVEAATAGEAGKGFAVVAQEVRNLASRSASAANEIKSIVESATNKAKEGKDITTKMIEGYNDLNENIITTIKLIDDVANASKEQEAGIEQISQTINSLDQATQQNASLANNISNMANQTSNLAVHLQNIIKQTSYDKTAEKRVCDTSMIIDINRLKSDHINFKNTNFAQCKVGHTFTVKNHHECNLGKWIDSNENKPFAQSQDWKELKIAHENVHNMVQNTIELYSKEEENSKIFAVTENIEKNIEIVFSKLDKIRENNCSNKY